MLKIAAMEAEYTKLKDRNADQDMQLMNDSYQIESLKKDTDNKNRVFYSAKIYNIEGIESL
jgi:hypothetical protein